VREGAAVEGEKGKKKEEKWVVDDVQTRYKRRDGKADALELTKSAYH
jgi:hypothetical protein